MVTISRTHGSLGKQVGRVLSEKLGIPFYYKEMTALAAKESGLSREFISDINANSPTLFKSLYLSTDVVANAITAQDRIIKRIADNGSCVIVGRSADHVLRDYNNVVKVFITAPEVYRVKTVSEVYGDSEEDAKRQIKRADSARAKYYESVSGKKWGDAENYDVMINSSCGVEQSADMILDYLKSNGYL